MTDLALLRAGFDAVPEPDDQTVAAARAGLLRAIAADRPRPRRARTGVRLAFVLAATLFLLAGFATATYLGVRTWVSTSPRGPQVKNDYLLTRIFTPPEEADSYSSWQFALDPPGHDLYALRRPYYPRAGLPELMRIRGVDRGAQLHATPVLAARDLAGPRFLPSRPHGPPGYPDFYLHQALAVAPNGDVFLLVTGRDPQSTVRLAGSDVALFVLHPDGTRQQVLSVGQLVRSRMLPNARSGIVLGVAATGSNRLWLDTESWSRTRGCDPGLEKGDSPCHSYRFFQVVDPNADGDWADRVVRAVALPREVSAAIAPWPGLQLVAEPSLPGDDRARSVLANMYWDRGKAKGTYRIADRNDDGDARDPGEVRVVLTHHTVPAFVAPRTIRVRGVLRRELVVAGLSRPDRVSLISASGAVTDIARSFQSFTGLLAGPKGLIYLLGSAGALYRLQPTGAHAHGGTTVAPAPPPPPDAAPVGGEPHVVYSTLHGTFAIGVDGNGLRKLPHGAADCFSTDGRMMAYRSDVEAPHELFTYVAATDGSSPLKVTERDAYPVCPFASRWLLLSTYDWPAPLIRHDLRTGREGEIARVHQFSLSPNGRRVAYVGESADSLVLLDVGTLRRRLLAHPPAGASFDVGLSGPTWSPDGRRIAYATGPSWMPGKQKHHRYVVWVRDVASGAVLLRVPIFGGTGMFAWSPDGESLLVWKYVSNVGKLLLVSLADRSVKVVAGGQREFAEWAPSGGAFAYATSGALFLHTPDGQARRLATAPRGRWRGTWLGWSPDGRYVGFYDYRGSLITADAGTGRVRVIRIPARVWPAWWRTARGGS